MTTVPDTEMHRRQLASAKPASLRNSPILYGLGSFGLESAYKVFWGFYIFYYVDVLGLSVTLSAIVNVVYGIWDAVNDSLFGYLSDNTRTRLERRRPWLLVGLPLFWYALVMVLTFETASTVMSVNYDALFPELFQGFRERSRASDIYQGFCMSGELVGFALTTIVYTQLGFVGMALLFGGVTAATLLPAILSNREHPRVQEEPRLGLRAAFRDVLCDRLSHSHRLGRGVDSLGPRLGRQAHLDVGRGGDALLCGRPGAGEQAVGGPDRRRARRVWPGWDQGLPRDVCGRDGRPQPGAHRPSPRGRLLQPALGLWQALRGPGGGGFGPVGRALAMSAAQSRGSHFGFRSVWFRWPF